MSGIGAEFDVEQQSASCIRRRLSSLAAETLLDEGQILQVAVNKGNVQKLQASSTIAVVYKRDGQHLELKKTEIKVVHKGNPCCWAGIGVVEM